MPIQSPIESMESNGRKQKTPYRKIRALGLVAAYESANTDVRSFDEARSFCKGSGRLVELQRVTKPLMCVVYQRIKKRVK